MKGELKVKYSYPTNKCDGKKFNNKIGLMRNYFIKIDVIKSF